MTTTNTTSTDFTAANRTFFDDLAARYDIDTWQKKLFLQITTFIQQNLDFIGIPKHKGPITLLDYACGTGMISRALGPSVTSIQALDLSSKMVERYNELAASSEIASVRTARAVQGNLLTDPVEVDRPELFELDVAAVGGGLHHFDDPGEAIGRLASRLKAGGVLLIVDFVEEEEGGAEQSRPLPVGVEHTIRKHGFSEKEMRGMMERYGLGGFGWKEMPERLEMMMHEHRSMSKRWFLARAAKTSTERD